MEEKFYGTPEVLGVFTSNNGESILVRIKDLDTDDEDIFLEIDTDDLGLDSCCVSFRIPKIGTITFAPDTIDGIVKFLRDVMSKHHLELGDLNAS